MWISHSSKSRSQIRSSKTQENNPTTLREDERELKYWT